MLSLVFIGKELGNGIQPFIQDTEDVTDGFLFLLAGLFPIGIQLCFK